RPTVGERLRRPPRRFTRKPPPPSVLRLISSVAHRVAEATGPRWLSTPFGCRKNRFDLPAGFAKNCRLSAPPGPAKDDQVGRGAQPAITLQSCLRDFALGSLRIGELLHLGEILIFAATHAGQGFSCFGSRRGR